MRNVKDEIENAGKAKLSFYLTDEECKEYRPDYLNQISESFYLTDEECKGSSFVMISSRVFCFYLTDEECKAKFSASCFNASSVFI